MAQKKVLTCNEEPEDPRCTCPDRNGRRCLARALPRSRVGTAQAARRRGRPQYAGDRCPRDRSSCSGCRSGPRGPPDPCRSREHTAHTRSLQFREISEIQILFKQDLRSRTIWLEPVWRSVSGSSIDEKEKTLNAFSSDIPTWTYSKKVKLKTKYLKSGLPKPPIF